MSAERPLVGCVLHDGADIDACGCPALDSPGAIAYRGLLVKARAEIARLTADLAAARAVPADVEAALCDSSCWICDREDPIRGANLDRVKAAIARAISDATVARGTVGGLLATAPVGAIVEAKNAIQWVQFRIAGGTEESAWRGWWWANGGEWLEWQPVDNDLDVEGIRQPARLVDAATCDASPESRGPLPKGG